MVTFIPPYCGEEIKSNAEKKIYDVLQNLNMKNAYVLHSLGLPRHRNKIYGEIDFVVVCDRGIACLEIKGGRVECREGHWFFTDRYNVEREKSEGPFAQITGNMLSLRDALKRKFKDNLHIKNILMASGVMFPDIEFESRGEEIIPEIIYDITRIDITAYINDIFDYWQTIQPRNYSLLSPSDIKEIINYLRGEFCFVPTLGSRLENVEEKLIRLTNEQCQVMDALSMNKHLLIEGGAGTGKTMLALHYAVKMAEQGKRVLYLAYNKNLINNVKMQAGEYENLKIINLHALFGDYVNIDIEKVKNDASTYFSEELPNIFMEYLDELSEDERKTLQFDLLIMDEGQDIIDPNYMYPLDSLLKGGLDNGQWAIFYDGNQNIYNPEFQNGMELWESYEHTKFRLFVNCRNTVQIGRYSEAASGQEMSEYIRENGEEVNKITYEGQEEFCKKIKEILKKLKEENIKMEDVCFLSPKKYKHSNLATSNIKVNELGGEESFKKGVPYYATIQGFKGLDSKIVILIDVDDIWDENYSQYIYIAATRARTLLYVVGTENFWEKSK